MRTRGDEVFDALLTKIHTGELGPGDPINETLLAQEFQVSRGPVREAVRRLQGIQLVSHEAFLKARVVELSPRRLVDLFQMREALEGYACRLATQRMPDTDVAALMLDLETARAREETGGGRFDEHDFDFHRRIAQASENQRIIETLTGDMYHLMRLYRRQSGSRPQRKSAAYAEHWQIVRAIRARDPDLAESLMRSHIQRATEHLESELAQEARRAQPPPAGSAA